MHTHKYAYINGSFVGTNIRAQVCMHVIETAWQSVLYGLYSTKSEGCSSEGYSSEGYSSEGYSSEGEAV